MNEHITHSLVLGGITAFSVDKIKGVSSRDYWLIFFGVSGLSYWYMSKYGHTFFREPFVRKPSEP